MDKNIIFAYMKRIIILAVTLMALSCSKDNPYSISPEELLNNPLKAAKTTIVTKGPDATEAVTSFNNVAAYRQSEFEGQSWFIAFSGGRMVYDMFVLSFYFDSIDNMKVGKTLKPNRFMFSFVASSDSNATTYEYEGKITLADKGDDYVILYFDNVHLSCSLGDYLTNGYLYCPLHEKFEVSE